MSPKVLSVLAIFLLSVVFSQLELCEAALVSDLEKAGYKFLGKFEDAKSTAPVRGLREESTYYFVSEETATHLEALQYCQSDFNGQLVKPLNSEQINNVRLSLESVGEISGDHFWTGGIQIGTQWYWHMTGKPISNLTLDGNFGVGHNDIYSRNRCLALADAPENFGFCNAQECSLRLRYICEVQTVCTLQLM